MVATSWNTRWCTKWTALGLFALAGCLKPNPAFDLGVPTSSTGDSTGAPESSSAAGGSTAADTSISTTEAGSAGTETAAGSHGEDASASSVGGALCGDGQIDGGEECDDGAALDGDGCAADCRKEFRRVFVTSTVFTGDLGGLVGADAKCQAAAESVGLPGRFKAWLSADGLSPETTFVRYEVPYLRIDDVEVASDWQDLIDGQLKAQVGVSETGGLPGLGVHSCEPSDIHIVWTNTQEKGNAYAPMPCDNWAGDSGMALVGGAGFSNFGWTQICSPGCSDQAALYCFEQ